MTAFTRRNDQDFVITVTDAAGAVVPLTGFTAVVFTISRKRGSAALVTKSLADGVAITDAANGVITVSLTDTDTDRVGTFWFECRATDGVGGDTTVASGYLTIEGATQ